jgi:shikimate 5-dehydrogenase
MSKDWTPDELAAASAAMEAVGHMGYEEFCTELNRQARQQMDGFTADGMHWYLERASNAYDLFTQESVEADSYRLAHTGSYDECMKAIKNS